MMKLQNDNYSVLAREVLPVMLDSVLLGDIGSEEKAIADALRKWNFFYNPQLTAPSYFHTWFTFMERLTWDEFDADVPLPRPDEYQLSWMLRKYPGDSIFDIKGTEQAETYADIIRESLSLAADSIESWKEVRGGEPLWYRYKGTRIQHLVPQFRAFGKFNIETGGFEHIVNAATGTHGPSWRLVVELADTIRAWGIYAGGQSGNPGSPYYDTFVDDWAQGKYFKILYLKDEQEAFDYNKGFIVEMKNEE
jgi:penicillin amidase